MRFFAYCLLLLGSGLFSDRDYNLFSIPFATEITLAGLTLYSFGFILTSKTYSTEFIKLGLSYILIALCALIISTLIAGISFGQPAHLGIITERKTLLCLSFFPAYYLLRSEIGLRHHSMYRFIMGVAILSATASWVFQQTIVVTLDEEGFREDRAGVGVGMICMAILWMAARWLFPATAGNGRIRDGRSGSRIGQMGLLAAIIYLFLTMIFVAQTRQFLIALVVPIALYYLLIFAGKPQRGTLWGATVLFGALLVNLDWELVLSIFSSDYLEFSARSKTYSIIWQLFLDNPLIGRGALNPDFHGGFKSLYHSFFFLADVGIAGTQYRFGIFGPLILIAYLGYLFKKTLALPASETKVFLLLYFSFVAVCLPVGTFIEHRGFMFGIVLAVLVVERERHR